MPDSTDVRGWHQLRKVCLEWQKGHKEPGVFFSCPVAHPESIETYNCLLFEILLCLHPLPEADCVLGSWLQSESAKEAAHIFRDLCYRSYRHTYRESLRRERANRKGKEHGWTAEDDQPQTDSEVRLHESGPYVWRHWYNTLNQYMTKLTPEDRTRLSIQPLYGRVTTAGEWYLAMPAYSAAPEVGWNLIQMLTTADRELQRVYLGVGLPTRKAFYGLKDASGGLPIMERRSGVATISPFFDLKLPVLQHLVTHAFRRSAFPCYQQFTESISAHLKRILELPEPQGEDRDTLYDQVNHVIDDLAANVRFVQSNQSCDRCHN